jgi:hypothetical protein
VARSKRAARASRFATLPAGRMRRRQAISAASICFAASSAFAGRPATSFAMSVSMSGCTEAVPSGRRGIGALA